MKISYSEIRAALRYRDQVLSAAVDNLARTRRIYTDPETYLRDHADKWEREFAHQMLNVLAQVPADVLTYIENRDRLRLIEPAIAKYTEQVEGTRAQRRQYQTRLAVLRQRVRQGQAALDTAVLLGETTYRQRATLARRTAALAAHERRRPPEQGEMARAALRQLVPELRQLTAEQTRLRPAFRRYFPAVQRTGDRRSLQLTPQSWREWDEQCRHWRAAIVVEDFLYEPGTGLLTREGHGPVTQRTVMAHGQRVPVNWLIPWIMLYEMDHLEAEKLNLWVRPQCPYAGNWKQGYWWRWSDILGHQDHVACHSSGAYSRIDDGRPTPPGVSFIGGWHWYMNDGRIIAPGIGEIQDRQIVRLQF